MVLFIIIIIIIIIGYLINNEALSNDQYWKSLEEQ